ncbi:tetratricopeptide repeat protein 39B-like [Daphnia pulex]|uniref:tetratricopeptide repeat protein 39B-like n=1 Tax=Daphnia pulex TaxID=6669 RepID=UPI001EDE0278|nr:tetratricopeptide repeat protein 39B-like [Daphnia pulex]XP_046440649.1 tetratricopeptide repeat protein 39B-like [Daphnia pulex]XP_046440650.1 tetratricopeptide repeat protein 39B-like [Daphnia pulex]
MALNDDNTTFPPGKVEIDDEDEFADPMEETESPLQILAIKSPSPNGMTLETAIDHCREALDLFFDNKLTEAKAIMEPWSETSYYHALGNSVLAFLQAILTFEQRDIGVALDLVKQSIEISNQYRRKTTLTESFGRILKRTDYNLYTEEQIHAELCFAESMLLKAVLTFTEDETLMSFVKGGLKIRSCYQSYKECWNMLNHRKWTDDHYKVHFESGVRLGAGSFNLMISLLPQRVLKLLEFIGFSGSRSVGLSELEKGYELQTSIRRVLCAIVLLGYHLIVVYVLSNGEGNLVQANAILEEQLKLKPNGVWFLFFKGRYELVQAHVDDAIVWYERSWHSQNSFPQFHHLCFWELMWAHSMKMNWKSAGQYARRLFEESRWSKCIYAYVQAAFLCMDKEDGNLSDAEHSRLISLMREVPSYKQRIAGKSLPAEKFVIRKSARFFAQGDRLRLAALELLYVWNILKIIGKERVLIQPCYRLIERTIKDLEARKQDKYYSDDLALALLLKGCCLRSMNSPLQAEECFLQVSRMEKMLQDDTYLIPYSVAELGFLYHSQDKNEQAILWLEAAKNNYKGYSLESRLHFRIHAALSQLKAPTEETGPEADYGEMVMSGLDSEFQQLPTSSADESKRTTKL